MQIGNYLVYTVWPLQWEVTFEIWKYFKVKLKAINITIWNGAKELYFSIMNLHCKFCWFNGRDGQTTCSFTRVCLHKKIIIVSCEHQFWWKYKTANNIGCYNYTCYFSFFFPIGEYMYLWLWNTVKWEILACD